MMNVTIPLDAFTVSIKQKPRLLTLNQWNLVSRAKKGMYTASGYKKRVVSSKEHNNFGEYTYVTTDDIFSLAITMGVENATKFDTKEEAESWANSHQEVIEVVG